MTEKLYKIISQVMKIPISEISDQSGPDNIDSWDSFNGLVLVDELESEFNIEFTINEVGDVSTVEDIKRHLKNHGISLNE